MLSFTHVKNHFNNVKITQTAVSRYFVLQSFISNRYSVIHSRQRFLAVFVLTSQLCGDLYTFGVRTILCYSRCQPFKLEHPAHPPRVTYLCSLSSVGLSVDNGDWGCWEKCSSDTITAVSQVIWSVQMQMVLVNFQPIWLSHRLEKSIKLPE